jgi:hypothetical protein
MIMPELSNMIPYKKYVDVYFIAKCKAQYLLSFMASYKVPSIFCGLKSSKRSGRREYRY